MHIYCMSYIPTVPIYLYIRKGWGSSESDNLISTKVFYMNSLGAQICKMNQHVAAIFQTGAGIYLVLLNVQLEHRKKKH